MTSTKFTAPEGYEETHKLQIPEVSHTCGLVAWSCKRCGCVVSDPVVHDRKCLK